MAEEGGGDVGVGEDEEDGVEEEEAHGEEDDFYAEAGCDAEAVEGVGRGVGVGVWAGRG